MAATRKQPNLSKRHKIETATRTMFIWVALAAVAASFCVVTVQFLYQKWTHNNRVISAKSKAVNTLEDNIENAKKLQQEVDALVSNEALASVKTNPDDPNTKSILDALPSTVDTPALATSLQQAIASRSGVTIESITLPDVQGQGVQTQGATTAAAAAAVTAQTPDPVPTEQRFTITVSGTYDKLRGFMVDMERTIRPMKVERITLTGSDASLRGIFEVVTYYQPAKDVKLKEQVVQ